MTDSAQIYRPTPWGLVRICVFVVALLWCIGLLFPASNWAPAEPHMATEVASDPRIRPALAPRDDGRGVVDRLGFLTVRADTPSPATIAWVGGSSTVVNPNRARRAKNAPPPQIQLLPSKVLDVLADSCRDEAAVVDIYIARAMRTLDQYVFLQHALKSKPDTVVVTLNPLWIFNERGVNQRQDVIQGALYRGAADTSVMYWAGLIGQPANFAFASAARFLPVVRDRRDYHQRVSSLVGEFQPAGLRKGKKRKNKKRSRKFSKKPHRFWKCAPGCIETDDSGAGYQLLHATFAAIRDANINAVIYEAPVNMDLLMTKVSERPVESTRREFENVIKVQRAVVRQIAQEFSSPRITLVTADDWSLEDLKFHDMIHLTDAGTLPNELASRLSSTVCGGVSQ